MSNDKEPKAYPQLYSENYGHTSVTSVEGGMTLRDHFAGLAMAALLAREDRSYDTYTLDAAGTAYSIADCMMLVREEVNAKK